MPPLAFGLAPARAAESAGAGPKVPQGRGLSGPLCSLFILITLRINRPSTNNDDAPAKIGARKGIKEGPGREEVV